MWRLHGAAFAATLLTIEIAVAAPLLVAARWLDAKRPLGSCRPFALASVRSLPRVEAGTRLPESRA